MRREQSRWATRGVAAAASVLAVVLMLGPGRALAACGDGVVDAGEDCDDGGLCMSGDHAGEKCPAAAAGGVDCGEGVECKTFGGDECAADCAFESKRTFTFDTVKSKAQVQGQVLSIPFELSGHQVLTTSSHPDANGNYAVVVRADDVHIDPIQVAGLSLCACVRGVAAKTCGGDPAGRDCAADPTVCQPGEGACIFVNGPGNAASGTIGCAADGLSPIDISLSRDHNTHKDSPDPDPDCTAAGAQVEGPSAKHPGACNGPTVPTESGTGAAGSALLLNSLSITTINDGGDCLTETNTKICVGGSNPTSPTIDCSNDPTVCKDGTCVPAKGPDGIPCNDDDPAQAEAATVPLTTGVASTSIHNANNATGKIIAPSPVKCGTTPCVASVTGAAFSCSALAADPTKGAGGVTLGSAFPALDNASLGDLAITTALASVPDTPPCVGDCDSNGHVGVDELVKGVNIALGNATPDTCTAFDVNHDNKVTVDELVKGVNNATNGCPS